MKSINLFKTFKRYYSTPQNILNIIGTKKVGERTSVQGWVKSMRKMKDNLFLDISDGTSSLKIQVVISNALKPHDLTVGASVVASGDLATAPNGRVEINADNIQLLGKCILSDGYPFAPKKSYEPEYIRDYLHLRSRTNKFSSLLRVRNTATLAFHEYFNKNNFINIHTPILTSNDCEGAGEVFVVCPDKKELIKKMDKSDAPIDEVYFNGKVFLSVSGQMHLEAIAHGMSNVYSFGPTFRAENSRSRFHLSEFYMIEAESAFVDSIETLCFQIEDMVRNVTNVVVEKSSDDIKMGSATKIDLSWTEKKFPIITYDEAIGILKQKQNNGVGGFTKENEMCIVNHCGDVPTFVINWPKEDKPFYMKECAEDSTKVAAVDLLGPGLGEFVGGSLRENNYDNLVQKLPTKNLNWYLDLRKFGGVPTAGYGLGFERYLQLILGTQNIKDTIPFPRWPHNCNL